jgi:hypothetical protein
MATGSFQGPTCPQSPQTDECASGLPCPQSNIASAHAFVSELALITSVLYSRVWALSYVTQGGRTTWIQCCHFHQMAEVICLWICCSSSCGRHVQYVHPGKIRGPRVRARAARSTLCCALSYRNWLPSKGVVIMHYFSERITIPSRSALI